MKRIDASLETWWGDFLFQLVYLGNGANKGITSNGLP